MPSIRRLVRSVADLASTVLVLVVALPIWLAPLPFARRLGRFGGLIGFAFWGHARRAGMINLRRAYGSEMSRSHARKAVRTVFCNLGQSIAEGIAVSRRGPQRSGLTFLVEDQALADSIVADRRPKIFVTGHLGSWEVALMTVRDVSGITGSVIARGVDNRFLNQLVRWVRFKSPSEWIEKLGATNVALKQLQEGSSVAMLLDENGGPRGPFVPFFGRPASTRKTAALLSALTGSPVVVGAAVRRPEGLFLRLALIEPPENASRERILEVTTRICTILEGWIREDPLQWRWIHWRWRSRPDGSVETYRPEDVDDCFSADMSAGGSVIRAENNS